MGTLDVTARHGGIPGGQRHPSELVEWSAACDFDKYGHQGTWQCQGRAREKESVRLNGTE